MARPSNKFFNLMVLLLVVPAIIVAIDADISVSAATLKRMQRRSAFLAPEDAIEARDLAEHSHEYFIRDLSDHGVDLVRRDPSWKGFKNFIGKAFHTVTHVLTGRTPVGLAAKAASSLAQSNRKREPEEYFRRAVPQPLAAGEKQVLPEGSSKTTAGTGSGGVHHTTLLDDQRTPVSGKHHYEHDPEYKGQECHHHHDVHDRVHHHHDQHKNGIQGPSNLDEAGAPHHNNQHSGQLSSQHGAGKTAVGEGSLNQENERGRSQTPLGVQAAIPSGTAGHRRSFYYDMEDLD